VGDGKLIIISITVSGINEHKRKHKGTSITAIDILTQVVSTGIITSKTNKNIVLNSTAVCIELFQV